MSFRNKIVIITGGGQGIGACIAMNYAKEGANVILAEKDKEAGLETEEYINAKHENAYFIHTDISNEEDVKNMIQNVTNRFGHIDILVNNASINAEGTLFTRSLEEWQKVIDTNITGPYICTKHAAPYMNSEGSCIINIASTETMKAEPHTDPHETSKGALLALTQSLSNSLSPKIRVNSISPGWIDASQWKKKKHRKFVHVTEEDRTQHLVGRIGLPEDVAKACLFLTSEDASFITGQNMIVDGGMTVKKLL